MTTETKAVKTPECAPYSRFASVYDEFMDDFKYGEWCDFYLDLAGLEGSITALDAACGTGSMTAELIKRRITTIGCDISEQMLAIAQEKCRRHGGAAIIRQDMRALELHRPVDLVIATCDAVNYLTQGAGDFIASAYRCLKPGGALVFDITCVEKLKSAHGQVFFDDREDACCIWTNEFDAASAILRVELVLFNRTGGDGFARHDECHELKAYSVNDVTGLLTGAGFGGIKAVMPDNSSAFRSGRIHFRAVKG